ncbi:uncharacterized protein LOC141627358 [Silene latifolia]|uniref:uncharacterized protein LOC141627358 n=1 Tax=Silene latifolia TaxID=37657 RepID=UPI003D76C1A0
MELELGPKLGNQYLLKVKRVYSHEGSLFVTLTDSHVLEKTAILIRLAIKPFELTMGLHIRWKSMRVQKGMSSWTTNLSVSQSAIDAACQIAALNDESGDWQV